MRTGQKLTSSLLLSLLFTVPGSSESFGVSPSDAQAPSTKAPVAAPADETRMSSTNQDYVLGPGDQITLRVGDMEELSDRPIRIDPNGYVDLPLAGRLHAAGQTVEQFKTELASKLRKYINSPQISLNVTDDQNRPVSLLGAVNNPGVHQLHGSKRLLEVISMAGGVRPDAGSNVIVTRQSQWGKISVPGVKTDVTDGFSTVKISLDSLLAARHPAENIMVEPNDLISIPKAEVIYVVGNVKKAGGFQLSSHETISLLQAVSLAEGIDGNAAPRRSKILRPVSANSTKVNEIPVDLQKIFEGKAPDVQLYANDVLFVPNSLAKSSARRTAEAILQTATGIAVYRR